MSLKKVSDQLLPNFGHYVTHQLITQTNFYSIYLGQNIVEQTVFIEQCHSNDPKKQQEFQERVEKLKELANSSVAPILDTGIDSDGNSFVVYDSEGAKLLSVFLEEEFIELSESTILRLGEQLALSLNAFENTNLAHLDLRPENILLKPDKSISIIGMASPHQAKLEHKPFSKKYLDFASSEQIEGEQPTAMSNMFSVGVILYSLFAGHAPKYQVTNWDIFSQGEEIAFESLDVISKSLNPLTYQIIRKCLGRKPWDRYRNSGDFLLAIRDAIDTVESKEADSEKVPFLPQLPNDNRVLYGTVALIAVFIIVGALSLFRLSQNGSIALSLAETITEITTIEETAVPPTNTPLPPTNTPVPIEAILLQPSEGARFDSQDEVTFTWSWPQTLAEGDRFVLFIKSGNLIIYQAEVQQPTRNGRFQHSTDVSIFTTESAQYSWQTILQGEDGLTKYSSPNGTFFVSVIMPTATPTEIPTEAPIQTVTLINPPEPISQNLFFNGYSSLEKFIVATLLLTAICTLALAIYAWQKQHLGRWVIYFSLVSFSVAVWLSGYTLELITDSLSLKIIFAKIQYMSVVILPINWFVFSLLYADRGKWFRRYHYLLFLLVPLSTLLLVFSNEAHHLFWQEIFLNNTYSFSTLTFRYGIGFWVHVAYSFLFLFIGTIILLRVTVRWKNVVLFLGVLAPWIVIIGLFFDLNSFSEVDPSSFGFGMSSLLLGAAIFRSKLLDLVPEARRTAIDNMPDAMLVLDSMNRIADYNESARLLIAQKSKPIMGLSIDRFLPQFSRESEELVTASLQLETETTFEVQRDEAYYQVTISPVLNEKGLIYGRIISFHETTAQKIVENELLLRNQFLQQIDNLSQEINSNTELESTLNAILQSVTSMLDLTSAYITEWDTQNCQQTVIADFYSEFASEQEIISDLGETYCVETDFGYESTFMNETKDSLLVHADENDLTELKRLHIEKYGGNTVLEVPLWAKGSRIGTLELWDSRNKRYFSKVEVNGAQSIAQFAALAIDNANRYQETLAVNENKLKLDTNGNHELSDPFLDQVEIESREALLKEEKFSPTLLMNEVVQRFEPFAQQKGLELTTYSYPEFPEMIYGNPVLIKQIFFILISNAIKHTAVGEVNVELLTPTPLQWELKVIDSGIGIPPDEKPFIFGPDWNDSKFDEHLSKNQNSRGLSLAMVEKLTHPLKGEILFESEVDVGSTFSVKFPLIKDFEEVI